MGHVARMGAEIRNAYKFSQENMNGIDVLRKLYLPRRLTLNSFQRNREVEAGLVWLRTRTSGESVNTVMKLQSIEMCVPLSLLQKSVRSLTVCL
jgi:hypothetical protein